ncbi:glycoside hydrolase family 127 protein [Sinomicrobium soli]|uniref:glycoside hydrolase family 127 protein n=1 Tax=Sinomicrobium sp. N-1-3-6 TaxID=2219864 RepID=UPI000DCF1475|nr:beta-L-arabinofuranosidase domain-containing protein [Sinomicrobium sp. N-1-3-6]RAV29566.1 glycoside hydrolase family 127 protein [Sinomicrobium sp. N-1-3-6]
MRTVMIVTVLLVSVCFSCREKEETGQGAGTDLSGYPIEMADVKNVRLTDNFWLPVIERVQKKTISYAIEKCREEGRFDNFLIAGGKMQGKARGVMPFDDSDVYKIIEGASTSLLSAPDPGLESLLDSLIRIVGTGQEKDGYLTTWRTIDPGKPTADWVKVVEGKRWESLDMSHELYNAGHLYEAAAMHYRATGKTDFLDIALKNADLVVETFGDGPGKISSVPGHQIIETGLIKLYRITGKKKYLTQAKYFLDHRGDPENHTLYGAYAQDHIPVVRQKEAVGHAVRAVYMYAAMTDIAVLEKDSGYYRATVDVWNNINNKKKYLTGGIGSKHEGEAFGENYELPNLTAYNETCAAIGDVYWNQRMFNATGDVKYYDIIERSLYNGLISGLSLDGTHFFYPNPLESDGEYPFNQGAVTRKEWFDCSCCPTNLIRFLPSLPEMIYAKKGDHMLYVNLYASNEAEIDLNGEKFILSQQTDYPWKGQVNISVRSASETPVTLMLRVPEWCRNTILSGNLYEYEDKRELLPELWVNGEKTGYNLSGGYIALKKQWKPGEEIRLNFPMEVRKVRTNDLVAEDQNKTALEYGPVVYAFEEADNPSVMDNLDIAQKFETVYDPDLLGGVNILKGTDNGSVAIPYFTWSNRGAGKMKVWVND